MKKQWLIFIPLLFLLGFLPLIHGVSGMLQGYQEPKQEVILWSPPPEPPRELLEAPQIDELRIPEDTDEQDTIPLEEPTEAPRPAPEVIRFYVQAPEPEEDSLSLDKLFTIFGTVNSIAMGWVMVFFHFRHKRND